MRTGLSFAVLKISDREKHNSARDKLSARGGRDSPVTFSDSIKLASEKVMGTLGPLRVR